MPSVEIRSYRVGVVHRAEGDFRRYLALQPAPGAAASGGIWLYFGAAGPAAISERGGVIVASLPETLFGDIYHVLQTERPAFFVWEVRSDGAIHNCGIGTAEELPGEGWTDRSG